MFATRPAQATNKVVTVPAPIGGLNARDSLAAMPETDAVTLQNFWPQPYGLAVRNGWQKWASIPSGGEVGTLAAWSGVTGAQKLFAWADGGMWDVSVRGAFLTFPIVASLSGIYWQHASMSNAAGAHLIAVNGADDGIVYDETGVHRLVLGDGTTAYTWAGLDPQDAIQLTVHQHRLWATELDSAKGWYLPLDAIYGTLESYDFGPLFPLGGYIAFMTTWTIDDGNGAEDHLVVVSSTGHAVVYAGIDPADAATWALVGVYYIGAPVLGRRGYTKVGGDLFILTQQGIISMAGMLSSTRVNDQRQAFPSDKIQFMLSDLISSYSTLGGWQLGYVPKINMLICNVPTTVAGGNIQLVSNQITNAWAQFIGMDAACWTTFGQSPFFGTYDGYVCIAWEGTLDDVGVDGVGGNSINAFCQQAYSYLGSLATQKQVGMYRPNWLVGQDVAFNSAIGYNFNPLVPTDPDAPVVPPDPYGARWDEAIWDQSKWYGGTNIQLGWVQAIGMGVAASLAITVRANQDALWISTDYSYKVGGVL